MLILALPLASFLIYISASFETTVIGEGMSSEEIYIVKPKATCHITRQASMNAHASVRYPILTVKQAALLARDESLYSNFI